eukprot:CAMPEP_0202465010 /NCGR_PEP_ID=MMETSP1360-20130828/64020_1 /ASSEMBLY_ACC=CAM_ASM_000848 /TAXON_ID=515479 /ORGANISM="Licmophora paradoxa, Strain CCMP2313" /LENGTH=114 /DNA_ID=CAMNT_0049088557 /DNA_START=66 /DNA_END=410 /DNA_ORIENTATION=-
MFSMIFDLTGFSVTMVAYKNRRLMIRKLIYIAQTQYPERLKRCFLVNAPYGFETAWSLIRPLLDEKTASKIIFAKNEDMLEEIDADTLSVSYGGNHDEYRVPMKQLEEELKEPM